MTSILPAPQPVSRHTEIALKPLLAPLSRVQAILFDLDFTICPIGFINDLSVDAAVSALKARNAWPALGTAEVRSIVRDTKVTFGTDFRSVLPKLEAQLGIHDRRVLAEINWRYDKAEADNMQLTPGAFELLVFLARNQRKIGIVTNGDSYRQWQKLFITGIADFFRPVIISEEVRLRKPCPEIYQLALNQLGVEAQNCAFVGDSPSEDIAGANSVGLVSIRIRQGKYCSVEPLNELEEPIYEFNSLFELESALSSAFECPPDMRAQTTPSRKLPKVQNEISFNLRRSNSIPHEVGDED